MAQKALPTPAQLRQLLIYNPVLGSFTWRHRDVTWFRDTPGRTAQHECNRWNSRYAGKPTFTKASPDGYVYTHVLNMKVSAHRVAFAMHTGEWPRDSVDHINGNCADNRISNLREATRSQNMRNSKAKSRNKSGLKGVSWHTAAGAWCAQIRFGGKGHYLGLFDTPEEAHAAYVEAAKKHHGEFARFE